MMKKEKTQSLKILKAIGLNIFIVKMVRFHITNLHHQFNCTISQYHQLSILGVHKWRLSEILK